jgi:hypothetical protein
MSQRVSNVLAKISEATVEPQRYETLDPDEKCVRQSAFHVTISTNIRFSDRLALAKATIIFGNALNDLFENHIKQCIKILTPGDEFDDVIGSVKINTTLEYAWSSGLHSHSIVDIIHASKVHINPLAINLTLQRIAKFQNRQGKGYRVHVSYIRRSQGIDLVRKYIMKQVRGKQRLMCEGIEFPDTFQLSHELNIAEMVIKTKVVYFLVT